MIKSLYLRNFKGIARAEIPMERLTVIVGPNASGKTSILEGLSYLSLFDGEVLQHLLVGRRDLSQLYRRQAAQEEMQLGCSQDGVNIRLRIVPPINILPKGRLIFARMNEGIPDQARRLVEDSWFGLREVDGKRFDSPEGWLPMEPAPLDSRHLETSEILRFEASVMSAPSFVGVDKMSESGYGLSSTLANILLSQPDDFQVIQRSLTRVIPSIKRIRFERIHSHIVETVEGLRRVFSEDIPADDRTQGQSALLGNVGNM